MPGRLPDGDPAPLSGELPAAAVEEFTDAGRRGSGSFGAYVHVPFCLRRCGYCDFNTYTPRELGGEHASALTGPYLEALLAEIRLAGRVLPRRPFDTVFFGGGTPTLLEPEQLGAVLTALDETFGLASDVEVTTEANPDTVDPATHPGRIEALAGIGITRMSLGMQSAMPHVLATLDRTHDQGAVGRSVEAAHGVGLATSVDLIYGTPGESLDDWRRSLEAAIALRPDHVSAYALVVEEGTRLAAQVRRGVVPAPEDDDEADKYELADALLSAAGYRWYEVSNWSATDVGVCRHNEGYWRSDPWWGFGPGSHSHVGGVRWWNVRHPAAYANRLGSGESPAQAREILGADQRYVEDVMLRMRLAEGLPPRALAPEGRAAVPGIVRDGLAVLTGDTPEDEVAGSDPGGGVDASDGRMVLTERGRLLADTVLHRLLG
ncbi:radical SAM family heme chaperone HemW [Mobilicoccus pelagius]|uniref:Heme chaperone HemW n=1 Tax=Mobilicoccus pelagius NBRC 104925 TaxID=1089455 RepID=H5UPV9_9MICO|nr:radical SAM family heme chaperone HemW [Mobilicoccus pelagius]GAB47764.1 oxygen-independent coproporphyrinogen III oxidase [Mobilicoccus pelagius NBRC 104925]